VADEAGLQGRSGRPRDLPRWAQTLIAVVFLLGIYGEGDRHGWAFGLADAVLFGGFIVLAVSGPVGMRTWARRHPLVDGATSGPLAFFVLAGLTPLPLRWCLVVGLAAGLAGIARAERRRRARARG
jgi:hypothetical protein